MRLKCGHQEYGRSHHCAEMICSNYIGKKPSPEEFLREVRAVNADAAVLRNRLDSVWTVISSGEDDDQRRLAREEFVRLLEGWGEFPSVVLSWLRELREAEGV
jgi:hypothetical protein